MWESGFVAYLEDDPGSDPSDLKVHLRKAGTEFVTYDAQLNEYVPGYQSNTQMVRVNSNLYERRFKNGSKEIYGRAIGTTGPNRKVLLTETVDPHGQALVRLYDTNPAYPTRLKYLVDASGLATEFFYEEPNQPYSGQSYSGSVRAGGAFFYADLSGAMRLKEIQDVQGLRSSFTYDANGLIDSMTTPYGTTQFEYSSQTSGTTVISRYVQLTDPRGEKERMEYYQLLYPPTSEPVPSGPGLVTPVDPDTLRWRNVYYWDKKAMQLADGNTSNPGATALATIFHYLHDGTTTSTVLESIKHPLQSRIW